MSKRSSLKYASLLVLAIWAGLLSIVVSSLMAGHWVTLPHPEAGERLAMDVQLDGTGDATSIATFHFLYGDCPCSRRVLSHVIRRKAIDHANERIVLIGEDPQQQLAALNAGFEVDLVKPDALMERYGVESAPLLVVTRADGTILYSGGYTKRKQGLDYRDTEVISNALVGKVLDGLPPYGCAVSERLQNIIDPLSLKY